MEREDSTKFALWSINRERILAYLCKANERLLWTRDHADNVPIAQSFLLVSYISRYSRRTDVLGEPALTSSNVIVTRSKFPFHFLQRRYRDDDLCCGIVENVDSRRSTLVEENGGRRGRQDREEKKKGWYMYGSSRCVSRCNFSYCYASKRLSM